MIEEYYRSKRTPVLSYKSTMVTPTVPYTSYEADRAAKRGLSTEEYRARVTKVFGEVRGLFLSIGDTVWPTRLPDLKKHGKCIVVGVCRHYDDYGEADWNDPPYLLSVQPLKDRSHTIQCSVGWVTKQAPAGAEQVASPDVNISEEC